MPRRSNCVLVAPVTIGDGATIGGGSMIAKDAPAGQLTVARARQSSYAELEAADEDTAGKGPAQPLAERAEARAQASD